MIKLNDASLWKEQGFINGAWTAADSRQTTEIRNPATGEKLGTVPHMGGAEARRAIEAAHAALPAWSKKTAGERARIMRKWFELMLDHQQDLAARHHVARCVHRQLLHLAVHRRPQLGQALALAGLAGIGRELRALPLRLALAVEQVAL